MKPEIKQKWIETLKSNKYKQGKYKLKRVGEEYCCLGVLCEVLRTDFKEDLTWVDLEPAEGRTYFGVKSTNSPAIDVSVLPPSVRISCGISNTEENQLVNLNDNHDYSFTEIADWIETNL